MAKHLLMIFLVFLPTVGHCEQRQDVVTFLRITGMEEGIGISARFYRQEIMKRYPKAPPTFYKALDADLNNYLQETHNYYVRLYSNEFSKKEMESIVSFFVTPAGKKLARFNTIKLPEIAQFTSNKMKEIDEKVEKRLKQQ